MPRLTATQFFILLLAAMLLLGFGYGATIDSEAMMAVCGTGGLGAVVVAAVFLVRGGDGKPPTTLLALAIGAATLTACGATTRVQTRVRVADTAVIEYMLAHGCEDGRVMLVAREVVIDSIRQPLAEAEDAACAGFVVRRIASLIGDAAGAHVAAVVEGLMSDGCRGPLRAVMAELDEGTAAAKVALEDICAE